MRVLRVSKPAGLAVIVAAGLIVGLAITLGLSQFSGSPRDELKRSVNSGGFDSFPGYVTNSPTPNAEQGYRLAVQYTEELDQIPCFCGCGQGAGHKSVRYCFIEQDDPKKVNILFDRHGAGCKVCVDIVLEAVAGLEAGKSLKEVRAGIEERWQEDRDSMTPTPPIEG